MACLVCGGKSRSSLIAIFYSISRVKVVGQRWKSIKGKIDREGVSYEEKLAVEEAGRRGKSVPMDLEAEKVEPPLVAEAEKVEPSLVVEPHRLSKKPVRNEQPSCQASTNCEVVGRRRLGPVEVGLGLVKVWIMSFVGWLVKRLIKNSIYFKVWNI
jgi:hypothetical protein